jgi:DNA-binding transcriptional ArsR family regulator
MQSAFDVVAEPARRALLDELVTGPLPVGELARRAGLSQPNTSRHLRILREAGLVSSQVAGQRRLYGLRGAGFAELARWLTPYVVLWQGGLQALEAHPRRSNEMNDEHAVLSERDGRSLLRFRRHLGQSPERVWAALTERTELDGWHPTPFELEPRVGGEVRYPAEVGPTMEPGKVLAYEPPRLLAHTWGEDELRWTLEPSGEGCLLELEHIFDDRFKAARDGAGWHLCLQALGERLDGADLARHDEGIREGRLPDGWAELNREYQERFGISPEQATPVPSAPR